MVDWLLGWLVGLLNLQGEVGWSGRGAGLNARYSKEGGLGVHFHLTSLFQGRGLLHTGTLNLGFLHAPWG